MSDMVFVKEAGISNGRTEQSMGPRFSRTEGPMPVVITDFPMLKLQDGICRIPYPTISLFVFFRYLAGMGASSFQVIFMGFSPSWLT